MREAGSMLGCGVVHIVREGDSIVDELVRRLRRAVCQIAGVGWSSPFLPRRSWT